MGKDTSIIVDEVVEVAPDQETKTIVRLETLKAIRSIDKKLSTIARNLVEKLLPYFITEGYVPPAITLSEADGSDPIRLNDFVSNQLSPVIHEIPVDDGTFHIRALTGYKKFTVRLFKLYFPKNQASRISLVAHKREVSGSALHTFVPEFVDEFYDRTDDGESNRDRITS